MGTLRNEICGGGGGGGGGTAARKSNTWVRVGVVTGHGSDARGEVQTDGPNYCWSSSHRSRLVSDAACGASGKSSSSNRL